MISAYRSAREGRGEAADAGTLFSAIETDRVFRIPAIRLGEALAAREQESFQYLFTWKSPWQGGRLGSPHAIDIGFVFGTHALNSGSAEFFGSGDAADTLAGHVQDAWLAFAADADPRTDALDDWQPYSPDSRATALFDDPVTVAADPWGEERAVWDGVNAGIGGL